MLSKVERDDDESYSSRRFNLASEDDKQSLKTWCDVHWKDTFCKGIGGNNAATYHYCCICFSRKGYRMKDCHPYYQSASILKIPGLKNAKSADDLYKWIIGQIKEHQRLGKISSMAR